MLQQIEQTIPTRWRRTATMLCGPNARHANLQQKRVEWGDLSHVLLRWRC